MALYGCSALAQPVCTQGECAVRLGAYAKQEAKSLDCASECWLCMGMKNIMKGSTHTACSASHRNFQSVPEGTVCVADIQTQGKGDNNFWLPNLLDGNLCIAVVQCVYGCIFATGVVR